VDDSSRILFIGFIDAGRLIEPEATRLTCEA